MKICIDGRLIVEQKDGITTYLLNLIREIVNLAPDDQFTVLWNGRLSPKHTLFKITAPNLTLVKLAVREVRPWQQVAIPLWLLRHRFDVYHYPSFDMPIGAPCPAVFTLTDLKYLRYPEFFPKMSWAKRIYMRLITHLAAQRARYVIAISEHARQDILQMYRLQPESVVAIYLAAEALPQIDSPDVPDIERVKTKFNITEPYFLFVGQGRPHKNLKRVVEAFGKLQKANNTLALVIAGQPYPTYTAPADAIERLGLQNRVHFTGYVTDAELSRLYQGATALVYASLYEGFGLPMLEAMAAGTPVITSTVTCLPEIAGDAALLVDAYNVDEIAETLLKVATMPDVRFALSEKGHVRYRQFSWQKMARETLEVYYAAARG